MNVQDLLNDLAGVIHGTTINKIPNVYGSINRAARQLLLDVDPKETQRIVQLPQVFNSTYDYSLPVDVKGDKIIDLRLQGNRTPIDVFTQNYALTFDSQKLMNARQRVYIQHNTGVKSIRIEAPLLTPPTPICDTSSTTGWSGATITLDSTNNVAGGGALVFDTDISGTTTITNTTLTSTDLSAHENVSTLFLWAYIPTGADTTSFALRWGDTNGYWSKTITSTQQGTAFINGWNLLAFDWKTATKTGTPSSAAIDSLTVIITTTTDIQTSFKLCYFTSTLGYYFDLQYYSKYLFRDPSTNSFQETVSDTDSNKLINLDTESYNLLFYLLASYVAQSLQGADAAYDVEYWEGKYKEALVLYKAQNPNETIKKGETYYNLPNKGYTKFAPTVLRNY